MTKITKQKDLYIITFDSVECNTIVVKEFDWVKIACELRLNEVFLIKIPLKNIWYAIEIPKVVSKIISIFKQKINKVYEKAA
jgi:hypothetical protein